MVKKKLLVICGPTASGKTSFALELARKFNGELVSADSRQVYRGLDIGTGKDVSKDAWKDDHYEIEGVKLWGLDIADPKEEFSVSDFIEYTKNILDDIWKNGKLPILVGGTGFYIKALVDGVETLDVPKNGKLREELNDLKVDELFERLRETDKERARSLNDSDRKNPARLVRAIEVAYFNKKVGQERQEVQTIKADTLFIGLTLQKEILYKRIEGRVEKRVRQGVEAEIRKLFESGVNWGMQSMNTLGYKEWKEYFQSGFSTVGPVAKQPKIRPLTAFMGKPLNGQRNPESGPVYAPPTASDAINRWIQDEKNYSKRQMTWFKKDKRVIWFDVEKKDCVENIENLVQKWHNERNE